MAETDGPVVWSTIGEIASRDGISRQAVSKALAALVERGVVDVERDGRGRIARFSLAQFDHHRDRYANPAKVAAGRAASSAPAVAMAPQGQQSSSDSFDEARRRNEWLKFERAQLEHDEQKGLLVRADTVRQGVETAGREALAIIMRLPNRADELALSVSKEGVHGLRVMLRQVASDLATDIAKRLAELADGAPQTDDDLVREDEQ